MCVLPPIKNLLTNQTFVISKFQLRVDLILAILFQVESALRMSAVEFEEKFGVPQPQPDDPVIFVCRKGRRAADVKEHVRQVFNSDDYLVVDSVSR